MNEVLVREALEAAKRYLEGTYDANHPATQAYWVLFQVVMALEELKEPRRCAVCGSPESEDETEVQVEKPDPLNPIRTTPANDPPKDRLERLGEMNITPDLLPPDYLGVWGDLPKTALEESRLTLDAIVAGLESAHGPRVRSEYVTGEAGPTCSFHTFEDGFTFRIDVDGSVVGPVRPLDTPVVEEKENTCPECGGLLDTQGFHFRGYCYVEEELPMTERYFSGVDVKNAGAPRKIHSFPIEPDEETTDFCCEAHEALDSVRQALELAVRGLALAGTRLTEEHFDVKQVIPQEEEPLLACEVCGCGGLTATEDYCYGCDHIACVGCCSDNRCCDLFGPRGG